MKYLTPGPVQLPEFVIRAMARQPPFHRTEEFRALLSRVVEGLRSLYPARPVVMPGTGTLAVDSMVYNYVNPGEKVLAIVYGEFGRRAAEAARARGAQVVEVERDVPPRADEVEDVLRREGDVKAVLVVHNETSVGLANRGIRPLVDVAKAHGALLLVDSVSGFPAEPLPPEVDVVATASHKALLAPPGASVLYLGAEPRASAGVPPVMDLRRFLKSMEHMETPYTPPINVLYAMEAALEYIVEAGSKYVDMHRERAEALYGSVRLRPIPPPEYRSHTVAAFLAQDPKAVMARLREAGYVVAGGMYKYRDRSFRVGLMGDVSMEDIRKVAALINDVDRQGGL